MKRAVVLLCLLLALAPLASSQTQNPSSPTAISLTISTYSQNSDSLNLIPLTTSSMLPSGWVMSESLGSANTTYSKSVGASATGETCSYGSFLSGDHALGTLCDASLGPTIGAVFVNNTGSIITRLTISFTGEQWRWGGGSSPDQLTFGLNTGVSNLSAALTTGTFSPTAVLYFNSPVTSGTTGAVDGNATGNRTTITATITGLPIPVNQAFAIRWTDLVTGSGITDGLSITANGVPEPSTVIVGAPAAGGVARHQRHRLRRLVAAF